MSALRVTRLRGIIRPRAMRLGWRGLAATVAISAVLAGAFLWYRQSAFVAVRSVRIVGVSGPDAAAIRDKLQAAALGMTTLDVARSRLRGSVSGYPFIRTLRVNAHFPHEMTITVEEQVPIAVLVAGGQRRAVDGTGMIVRGGPGSLALPAIRASGPPAGASLTGLALRTAHLLAAAPYALIQELASADDSPGHGLQATLRAGTVVDFGAPTELRAKWESLIAVLASGSAAGASYIDVSDPGRPAAGGDSAGTTQTSPPTGEASSAAAPGSETLATPGQNGQSSASTTG